jgi:hypothetical protein
VHVPDDRATKLGGEAADLVAGDRFELLGEPLVDTGSYRYSLMH